MDNTLAPVNNSFSVVDFAQQFLAGIQKPDSVSLRLGIDPKTGKQFFAASKGGVTYLQTLSASGLRRDQLITPPERAFTTKEERDKVIVELKRDEGFSQDGIAEILGVSQSTVSRVLRRENEKSR